MEVVKGYFFYGTGKMNPGGADIRHVHVHRQGSDGFQLAVIQTSQITRQAFNSPVIRQRQRLSLCIRDNSDILMPFFESNLIHTQMAC